MNIGCITYLRLGGERAAGTAQSMYWSCHDTIRPQILDCRQSCDVEMPHFGGKTSPFPKDRVFRVVRPVATVRFRVEPELQPTREFGPVGNTTHRLWALAANKRPKFTMLSGLSWYASQCYIPIVIPFGRVSVGHRIHPWHNGWYI